MSAVGKIINGVFVPFGEENRQQFIGTPEEINQNIESGQLQNGATVFDNGTNKSIGKIENGEYVPYTGGDTTVDFTETEERENIESSNPIKIIFGKVKKWFSDFGEAAFANIANNRVTNEPGFVMDARQGKEIQDQINAINSALDNIGGCGGSGTGITKINYTVSTDGNGLARIRSDINTNIVLACFCHLDGYACVPYKKGNDTYCLVGSASGGAFSPLKNTNVNFTMYILNM